MSASALTLPTPKQIDHVYLSHQKNGLVFSFAEKAAGMDKASGRDYVTAYQVHNAPSSLVESADRENRKKIAAPAVIGTFSDVEDGLDIVSHALVIKRPNSMKIGLPECFNFTAPITRHVGNDVLDLYGPSAFEKAQILFIAQRTTVPKSEAQRTFFSHWHDHMNEPFEVDLTYIFSTTLPTEFRKNGKNIKTPAENSLVRFGAEIEHRSQTNTGAETRRLWGTYIVIPESGKQFSRSAERADNVALFKINSQDYHTAAIEAERNNTIGYKPQSPSLLYAG